MEGENSIGSRDSLFSRW